MTEKSQHNNYENTIWCLSDLGDGEAAIAEAQECQRAEGVNRQDSLLFAIDEVCLRMQHNEDEFELDQMDDYERKLEELDSLLAAADRQGRAGQAPESFNLACDAYPNPFNSTVRILFHISHASPVKIAIFDLTGREITTVTEKFYYSGLNAIIWDASGFVSGEYIIKMDAYGKKQVPKSR